MNPNGLVEAAFTTSHTSISVRSKSSLSSLIIAILTQRQMFSSSFDDSATRADETRTTRSTTSPYAAAATSRQRGVTPPTIFGMVRLLKSLLGGSSRSGEKARKKSSPDRMSVSMNIGSSSSSVVPQ